MKKAITAIVAVVIVVGAVYFIYSQMKSLGYFQGQQAPPSSQRPMGPPPGAVVAPAPAAPAEAAPSASTTQ